jgi:hypothetical protein
VQTAEERVTRTAQRRVKVPADVARQVSEIATRRRHTVSALVWRAVLAAAELADHGLGERLPRAGTQPRGGVGAWTLRWVQDDDEYEAAVALIEDAGSTVNDVIRAWARGYIATDGRLL